MYHFITNINKLVRRVGYFKTKREIASQGKCLLNRHSFNASIVLPDTVLDFCVYMVIVVDTELVDIDFVDTDLVDTDFVDTNFIAVVDVLPVEPV